MSIIVENSLLINYLPADYSDVYQRIIIGKEEITPEEFSISIFKKSPWWVEYLMKFRNLIVKPIGLQTGNFKVDLSGLVKNKNKEEIIFGKSDKHLNFYVSLRCSKKENNRQTLTITTIVKFNNLLGKVYFLLIRPFHHIIVNNAMNKI